VQDASRRSAAVRGDQSAVRKARPAADRRALDARGLAESDFLKLDGDPGYLKLVVVGITLIGLLGA
jgi:hypothetical protein